MKALKRRGHLRGVHVASQDITVSSTTLETIGRLLLGVEAKVGVICAEGFGESVDDLCGLATIANAASLRLSL